MANENDDFKAVNEVDLELVNPGKKIKTGTLKDFILNHSAEFKDKRLIFTQNKDQAFILNIKKNNPEDALIVAAIFEDPNLSLLDSIQEIDFLITFRNLKEIQNGIHMIKPHSVVF